MDLNQIFTDCLIMSGQKLKKLSIMILGFEIVQKASD